MKILNNKKILIFVSSSIAIFKILDLIRILIKQNSEVKVVATKRALKFIPAINFEALSGNRVLSDKSEDWVSGLNHIEYAKWAELVIFAPASANIINKLANGIASNVYLSCALALRNNLKLIAPSANNFMLENKITVRNLKYLSELGFKIITPRISKLVCNDVGRGALANLTEIEFSIKKILYEDKYKNLYTFWKDKKVIVTGGGSIEEIDNVRFISNKSSGKQASYLALALFYLGANVTFISSQFPIILPEEIVIKSVSSTLEFKIAISDYIPNNSFLFMAAAISDFIPFKQNGKIKKDDFIETWSLKLRKNEDILKSINNIFKVGFKAECDELNALNNAKKMLFVKSCELVCLNIINSNNQVFNSDYNEMYLVSKDFEKMIKGSKLDISFQIANNVCDIFTKK